MNPFTFVYLLILAVVSATAFGFYNTIADLNTKAVSCIRLQGAEQDKCLKDAALKAQALSTVVRAVTNTTE
ncbi:TPA: hypothetical protein QEM53_005445 [Pseudomonas putida]|uniref:hypothetical protein n=1 Tax=Pseudomonas putida TaxID=303 RepID=UPI00235C8C70|nr:hypothetical protein [Pseudomonas putida]GLO19882.1 hypothetical protein PPUJ20188_32790 [Pseudomonas putida]HDS0995602.1 hypothetical protein [Pseudomonas putida]HDS1764482.1 hypothetical protein [Pseudomonas putida]